MPMWRTMNRFKDPQVNEIKEKLKYIWYFLIKELEREDLIAKYFIFTYTSQKHKLKIARHSEKKNKKNNKKPKRFEFLLLFISHLFRT